MAAQLLLDFDGADSRVQLNLVVELAVIRFRKVGDEIASPGTAVAARRIKAVVNAKGLTFLDRNQFVRGFQCLQFVFVLDAREIEAVNLFILPEQRIVRRSEHRVPEHAANTAEMKRVQDAVAAVRGDAVQSESAGRR